jgi:uncharacterized repeat protein (TIGR01451 family)
MTLRPACLAALAAVALAPVCFAQAPPCCPPLPGRGPSPLLYVRLVGPPGSRVTLYQGRAKPRSFDSPAVVGLRPGYSYRVMFSNFDTRPGLTLYPTIEVRDSLHLPPKLSAANHPATVSIDEDDLDAIRNGSMITKLIYLEHPDRAEPEATRPGEILQTNYPPHTDLWREAKQRGRPMILMHLGERTPSDQELAAQNVPGTILHPGDRSAGMPARPPILGLGCAPLFDPILGPRPPEEECFHDGGDRGRKVAIDGCDRLTGVDPEDTVATFRDSCGRKSVVCSNQVCICVPRFVALRTECPLLLREGVVNLDFSHKYLRQDLLYQRAPLVQAFRYDRLRGFDGRLRPSINVNTKTPNELVGMKVLDAQQLDLGLLEYVGSKKLEMLTPVQKTKLIKQIQLAQQFTGSKHLAVTDQVIMTAVVGRVENGPEVVSAEFNTRDLTVCCHEMPTLPDKPLVLVKCADKQAASIGDVITFSLRYSNVGGRAITDVAVTDSLSGRLEYVEGSAESDRDAVFTMQQNEAGSLVLRWEISGKLLPGQSGRIRFKAKVR